MALCAWTTRKLGLSAAIGASAAWIGFFAFRFNHPAFFSVCYAPWVLLPWLSILRGEERRRDLGLGRGADGGKLRRTGERNREGSLSASALA